jgi:hypothetical protein
MPQQWRLHNDASGIRQVLPPSTRRGSYVELSFHAEAGRPYRLWLRGRADGDRKANDSVFVQFSGCVDSQGSGVYRIGE